MKNKNTETPTPEVAKAYVKEGIHGLGGWCEGLGGLWHKTIPYLFGVGSSLNLWRSAAILARIGVFALVALSPIAIKKAYDLAATSGGKSLDVWGLAKGLFPLTTLDYFLGALALGVNGLPKIFSKISDRKKPEPHSPFDDLAAAINNMPDCAATSRASVDESLKLTLRALLQEMTELVGEVSGKQLIGATLLEFCDSNGDRMQVRCRTAEHEATGRPVSANRFTAYYVAREGRAFAQHNFLSSKNPFPNKRLTVHGSPPVSYKSVLYMPICISVQLPGPMNEEGLAGGDLVEDRCIGVICVHSERPYRFWRWGDQSKRIGGFSDVATERSLPYIALITKLLGPSAQGIQLEVS